MTKCRFKCPLRDECKDLSYAGVPLHIAQHQHHDFNLHGFPATNAVMSCSIHGELCLSSKAVIMHHFSDLSGNCRGIMTRALPYQHGFRPTLRNLIDLRMANIKKRIMIEPSEKDGNDDHSQNDGNDGNEENGDNEQDVE